MRNIIFTDNEDWGFFGTCHRAGQNHDSATGMYNEVAHYLCDTHELPEEAAREFLDSRAGRHLADWMVTPNGFTIRYPDWLAREINHYFLDK